MRYVHGREFSSHIRTRTKLYLPLKYEKKPNKLKLNSVILLYLI